MGGHYEVFEIFAATSFRTRGSLIAITLNVTGQTSRGTLTGTVTDSSGAVLTHATVKISQQGTGAMRQTTTNSAGLYRFDAVDLGTYSVSAQATGFQTEEKTGVEIESAHTTDVEFKLQVGAAKEIVTVEASHLPWAQAV